MTVTYETIVIIDKGEYFVAGELELELIDDGIGAYEYWGSQATDHHWCWDVADYSFEATDIDAKPVTDKALLKRIAEAYHNKAVAYAYDLPVDDEDEPVDDSGEY